MIKVNFILTFPVPEEGFDDRPRFFERIDDCSRSGLLPGDNGVYFRTLIKEINMAHADSGKTGAEISGHSPGRIGVFKRVFRIPAEGDKTIAPRARRSYTYPLLCRVYPGGM